LMLSRKYVEEVLIYVKNWPGHVRVRAEMSRGRGNDLDDVNVLPSDLPFQVCPVRWRDLDYEGRIGNARVVLCALDDWRQIHIPAVCVSMGVPVVCVTECSYKTRRQTICSGVTNPFVRLRRLWSAARAEKQRRRAVALADGLQCSGMATFLDYQALNANPLLFFHSRVERDILVSDDVLRERTRRMRDGGPLRLAFFGRLLAAKGPQHLPRVAGELRRQNVPFTLDIYGDGVMTSKLKEQVDALNLGNAVRLRGIVDFAHELVPALSAAVDLLVCCHLQGDPSSTCLEAMACGVPIAGYDSESFAGLAPYSQLGWTSPGNDPRGLARLIADLNSNRQVLADAAFAVRDFASRYTASSVFRARMRHLINCADQRARTNPTSVIDRKGE